MPPQDKKAEQQQKKSCDPEKLNLLHGRSKSKYPG